MQGRLSSSIDMLFYESCGARAKKQIQFLKEKADSYTTQIDRYLACFNKTRLTSILGIEEILNNLEINSDDIINYDDYSTDFNLIQERLVEYMSDNNIKLPIPKYIKAHGHKPVKGLWTLMNLDVIRRERANEITIPPWRVTVFFKGLE